MREQLSKAIDYFNRAVAIARAVPLDSMSAADAEEHKRTVQACESYLQELLSLREETYGSSRLMD